MTTRRDCLGRPLSSWFGDTAVAVGMLLGLVFFLAAESAVFAAELDCRIEVGVDDGKGNALKGVKVSAIAPVLSGVRMNTTDAMGNAVLIGLAAGEYRLELDLVGYQWLEVERILCPPGGNVRLRSVLEAVEGDEIVFLPSGPLVDADSTDIGWWLERRELEALPRTVAGGAAGTVLLDTAVESAAVVGVPVVSTQWQGRFLVDTGAVGDAPMTVVTRSPPASWYGEAGVEAGWGAAADPTGTRGTVSALESRGRAFAALGGGWADDRARLFLALEGGSAEISSEAEFGGFDVVDALDRRQTAERSDVLVHADLRWLPSPPHSLGLRLGGGEITDDSQPSTLFATPDSGIPIFDRRHTGGAFVAEWSVMVDESVMLRVQAGGGQKTERILPRASGVLAQDQTADGTFSDGFGNGIWSGEGGIASVDDSRRLMSFGGDLEWAVGSRHRLAVEIGWFEQRRQTGVDASVAGVRAFWSGGSERRLEMPAGPSTAVGDTRRAFFSVSDDWRVARDVTLVFGLDFRDLSFAAGNGRNGYSLGPLDTAGFGIGAVWDFEGRGRSRAWAHWSRSRPGLADVVHLRLSGALDVERTLDIGGNEPPESLLPSEVLVAPDMELERTDRTTLGVEYEVLSGIAVGFAGVHRRVNGGVATLSENDGEPYVVGAATGSGWAQELGSTRWQATAWVRKRLTSSWQASVALQWSRVEGTWSGPSAADFAAVDREYLRDVVVPEALTNAEGPLPEDREWRFELMGSWTLSAGPVLGGRVAYASGAPVSRLGALEGGYGLDRWFVEDRGSAGRTPELWLTDVLCSWPFDVGSGVLVARIEIRNLLNRQAAIAVDERWMLLDETQAAGLDPGSQRTPRTWGEALENQKPLEAHLGVAYRW